jgi:hypothetical protein
MISAYDDEDNAPMFEDFPAPYMIRTWEEVQEEWNERFNDAGADDRISPAG